MALPGLDIPIAVFAIAGMAGAVAGSTGAMLTAIAMTFEMTFDYNAMLPVIMTASISWAMRRWLIPESIYTIKLLRRGHVVPEGLMSSVDASRRIRDVMTDDFVSRDEAGRADHQAGQTSIVTKDGTIVGVLGPMARPGDDPGQGYIVVEPGVGMIPTLQAMDRVGATLVLVSRNPGSNRFSDIEGVVTTKELAVHAGQTARMLS
jgi:CIC family chloride channel protein